jgi:EAL domain-containing protein (putative c-di-GMP-specific phosphodiesterase class I)
MAFQPIVDITDGHVYAQEALVRGVGGESAAEILSRVSDANRYAFDQQCRITAIDLASQLKIAEQGAFLSINFLPNAVYEPRACISSTLSAAMKTGFPLDHIIFEFTETERLDVDHLLNILRCYRAMGFKTALDDFGAEFAGLGLLAKFQPDIVKVDMALIRDIDTDPVKRAIVANVLNLMNDLGITTICEGIETPAEMQVLRDLGVTLMQGYLFARPTVARLADPTWMQAELGIAAA